MITLELTEEEIGTLIDALGTWMELPEECEGEEWLRRQDLGADLDLDLREAFNRRHDGLDAAMPPPPLRRTLLSRQASTPASRLKKHPAPQPGASSSEPKLSATATQIPSNDPR